MIFYQVSSVSVVMPIFLVHTSVWHKQKSDVLLSWHVSGFLMWDVTVLDLIDSVKRALLPQDHRVFTKRRHTMVFIHICFLSEKGNESIYFWGFHIRNCISCNVILQKGTGWHAWTLIYTKQARTILGSWDIAILLINIPVLTHIQKSAASQMEITYYPVRAPKTMAGWMPQLV